MTEQISGSAKLNRILFDMNEKSGFPISILTDGQGLAIAASAQNGMDTEKQSAVVAFVQKTVNQVANQLGMATTDEFSLYDENGQHLVCRPFTISDHELILAVVVPDKKTRYRRSTNNAINRINQTWKEFWE